MAAEVVIKCVYNSSKLYDLYKQRLLKYERDRLAKSNLVNLTILLTINCDNPKEFIVK